MKKIITALAAVAVMSMSVVPAFAHCVESPALKSPVATKPCGSGYCSNVGKSDNGVCSPKTGDVFNDTAIYCVIGFSALATGGAAVALAKSSKKK